MVHEGGDIHEGKLRSHRDVIRESMTRKYRSIARTKREKLILNVIGNVEEGRNVKGNLKRNKTHKDEEKRQRHMIKNKKGKGKQLSSSEMNVKEMRHEENNDTSDEERKERKRPRLQEDVEEDFDESSMKETVEEEEEKGEGEKKSHDRMQERDVDQQFEMPSKSDPKCELLHHGMSQYCKGADQESQGKTHQQQVPSSCDGQASMASQQDAELLQKVVRHKKVDEGRKHQAEVMANMCDFELEELKVRGVRSRSDDKEEICKRKGRLCPVTPRPRCIPHTVSIRTLPVEEPSAVKLTAVKPQDNVSSSIMEIHVAGLSGECGSVTDPRLGHVGSITLCATCISSDCLGHTAYIDLRQYIFHQNFVMRCVQTLRKLCYHCLGPAVLCQRNLVKTRKTDVAQRRQLKFSKMWLDDCASESVQESNQRLCVKKQPRYCVVLRGGLKTVQMVMPKPEEKVVKLSASTIRAIFAEVSEHTWQYLGMKDPSDEVFIRYLRVCPSSYRSTVEVDGYLTPNSLTVQYNEVVQLRNELDNINLQIKKLIAGQDEMVHTGVRMLLNIQADTLTFTGQHSDAPSVVLCDGRGTRGGTDEDDDNEVNTPHKQVRFTSDAPRKGVTTDDVPPEGVDCTSEEELETMKEGNENYPDNLVDGGKVQEADKIITTSTPPHGEWLLTREDDDEMDISGCEDQEASCEQESNNDKEVCNGNGMTQRDRVNHIKQKVQKVAAKVSALHQNARKTSFALTSAVASVIQKQVSKICSKQGVMRHYLLGKRINQCARAVFTGDNSLPLGVVGIPRTIVTKLLQYVHIHENNLKDHEEMIDRFPEYPCVVSVVRGEQHFDIKTLKDKLDKYDDLSRPSFRLQVGDVVQRHLTSGDQVVVNRQPTLSKANTEAHTVRVIDSRAISLNISITDNYAADCDGDEVNLFVPSVESHASRMLDVSYNTVFSKSGKVSLKIKQDALRGAYSASLQDTFFTLEEFKALIPSGSQVPPPALLKPRRLWTGLQLLSLALPPSLIVDQAGVGMQLDTLVVRHGHMLSGVFDKGAQGKILECCKLLLGHEAIMVTVTRLQSIAERFVDEVGGTGFSFLSEDWSCPVDTLDLMQQEMQDVLSRAQHIECPQRRNAKLRQLLADQSNRLVPKLTRESSAAAMLKAGSKSRPQKLTQVCLAVGQHNQNDQLPARHLDGRRLLPFFSKDDTRPQTEGFIDKPMFGVGSITADALSGMVARSSSYKKHCATGDSGYLQRKLGKLVEDLTVRHDGTVRDANDEVVQLLYGDDGLLPECCFTVTLRTEQLPDYMADFYQMLIFDQCLSDEEQLLLKEELWSLWCDQHCLMREAKGGPIEASVPFILPHLMAHVLATVPSSGPPPSVTDIMDGLGKFFAILQDSIEKPIRDELQCRKEMWETVAETRRQLVAGADKADYPLGMWPGCTSGDTLSEVNVNREFEKISQDVMCGSDQRIVRDPLDMLKRYVRQHVNTFSILQAAFSKYQFSALLEAMTDLYLESRPAAGECVGALAAQALAEPLMQMTLNACHRAAVASDGDAIPRLTQLLNGQAEDALLEVRRGGLLHVRDYLVQEISQVYSGSGEAIDVRHVRLVVDYMLKEGVMGGYTRQHIPPQASFLKAAAFEQPLSLLQHAGTRGRCDNLLGVSQNLILDKAVEVGPEAYNTIMWMGLQSDVCPSPPPPPPQQHAQPSYDEASGQRGLDSDDDDDDTISVPEMDEACHA